MVSADNLFSYPYWTTSFAVQNNAYDKQFGSVISHNNKPITLLSRRLSKPQRNYTTTKKEFISIVECLNKLCGIIFSYEINLFSYHKIWYMPQP